jgi:hypothetical protein
MAIIRLPRSVQKQRYAGDKATELRRISLRKKSRTGNTVTERVSGVCCCSNITRTAAAAGIPSQSDPWRKGARIVI